MLLALTGHRLQTQTEGLEMGEARRRGTFEERKAEAIKAGRIKTPAPIKTMPRLPDDGPLDFAALLGVWLAAKGRWGRRKR